MPRGFPPQRIRQWTQTAHELAESDATVDVGFLVAYSAWEALQGRILAVALFRQGFAMSVAHEFLGSSDLNDRQMVKKQFAAILGRPPHQTSGLSATGRCWTRGRGIGMASCTGCRTTGRTSFEPASLKWPSDCRTPPGLSECLCLGSWAAIRRTRSPWVMCLLRCAVADGTVLMPGPSPVWCERCASVDRYWVDDAKSMISASSLSMASTSFRYSHVMRLNSSPDR